MASSTGDCNLRKRARTTSPRPADSTRGEPWHDDGNAILVSAESMRFRVHRSILMSHSLVFKDMFGLGQPQEVSVEGCPVVQLSDTTRDLQHALTALYDRSYFRPERQPRLGVAAALARIGMKYQMKSLHDDAKDVLCTSYPMDIDSFGRLPHKHHMARSTPTAGILLDFREPGVLWDVMALSRELDMPFLRPAAFALLCHWDDFGAVLDAHEDSQAEHFADELKKFLLAREKFAVLKWRTWSWLSSADCTVGACASYKRAKTSFLKGNAQPSAALDPLPAYIGNFTRPCAQCKADASSVHEHGRYQAWVELPEIMGLPGWLTLNSIKSNCVI